MQTKVNLDVKSIPDYGEFAEIKGKEELVY
jgi:hypothetical protein